MLPTLCGKCSTRAAWEAIKTIRVGIERVRESKAQELRREFAAITWKEGESIEDFSIRIGDDVLDAVVMRKMLEVVPEHIEAIAVATEAFLDLNTVTVEEMTSRLRAVEQRRRKPVTPWLTGKDGSSWPKRSGWRSSRTGATTAIRGAPAGPATPAVAPGTRPADHEGAGMVAAAHTRALAMGPP
jgi:hypothetical protein